MRYEHSIVELFVNQILRSKQIIEFIKSNDLKFNSEFVRVMFDYKPKINFPGLVEFVSKQIGEEETNVYLEGLELLNEYLTIISISSLINERRIGYPEHKDSKYMSINSHDGSEFWNIDALEFLFHFSSFNDYPRPNNPKNSLQENDNIPEIYKYRFNLVNLIILFASMLSVFYNKKLSIMADSKFSFKTLFSSLDSDKDGVITTDDIDTFLSKHKVKFSKNEIRCVFLFNKRINFEGKNVEFVDYFDAKSFKGFLYLFSFQKEYGNNLSDNENTSGKRQNNDFRTKSNAYHEYGQENVSKVNYSAMRMVESIISLSRLEERLESIKEEYSYKGELSLIDLFDSFDLENNEYVTMKEFGTCLEFYNVTDSNILSALFKRFAHEDKIR